MHLLALFWTLASPASACTWWWDVGGFEPDFVGATDVPTDADLIWQINGLSVRVDLVPTAGGPLATGALAWFPNPIQESVRLSFNPDVPLSPTTAYRADLFIVGYESEYDPVVPVATATFTTGTEPAPAPPSTTLLSASASPWQVDDQKRWYCTIGNPVSFRTVTLDVDVATPAPWSWLVVRDAGTAGASGERLQHVEPFLGDAGTRAIVFDQVDARPTDCFTVAVRMADGEELESSEVCLIADTGTPTDSATPADTAAPTGTEDTAKDVSCGCASGEAPASLPGLLFFLGIARVRRRSGA